MDASEELAARTLPVGNRPGFFQSGALRHRDFRLLWAGMLFSGSTLMFQAFAIGGLIVDYFPKVLGPGFPILLMLGIAGLTRGAGMFLFSMVGGALADRHDRRNLAVATQAAGLIIVLLFSLLIALEWLPLWVVFGFLFLTSAGVMFDLPARQALIPQLVEPQDINNGVALFTAATQSSIAVSPLFAGYFLDHLGIAGTYAASGLGHAALLLALLLIRPRGVEREGVRHPHILKQISEGFSFARGNRSILGILVLITLVSCFGMAIIANLSPFWLLRVLNQSSTTWGFTAAAWGVGGVITAYFLSSRGQFRRRGLMFLLGVFALAALFIPWSFVRNVYLFSALQFVMAGCLSIALISGVAMVQTLTPEDIRGRVMSLFGLNVSLQTANAITVGGMAEALGVKTAVYIIAFGMTAAAALGAISFRHLREID